MGGSYESTNHSEHAHQSKPLVLCDDIQAGTESDFWSYVRETLKSHWKNKNILSNKVDHTLGSLGGYLGVMSPIGLNELLPSQGNTIAVEFDTILDVGFHDLNWNQYLQLQSLFTKEGSIVIHVCREGELQALQ